ncbi:helix-turn-helix domain-containing protein [Massilicoli timonensis]|uniref:Helix-turn-helix domain-containing protein n=1 Tax=Massilicoli timonensis TaxID=2015901 RepID=A0ABT1SJ62_9FIRM|nr:helix-turn-helix domain-containing protein [Massilicoli timonensis]MCQ5121162.1 helix-turn-helix domain-containing protein [Massilicoli timonensis]
MSFGTYLKDVRFKMNVNQTQMAEILDISRTAIKLIENGSTKYPSKKVLHNLSVYLEQTEHEVMMNILFTDKDLSKDASNDLLVYHYLTYMYLEGWNIECSPYIYQVTESYKLEFDGKIVKKREPKNSIIVAKYDRFLVRLASIDSVNDAHGYMGDMLSIMMSVLDDFRSVNVLFDANDKKQCIIFDLFANLKYRKIGFNIKLILFDSIAEKCLSSIIYK